MQVNAFGMVIKSTQNVYSPILVDIIDTLLSTHIRYMYMHAKYTFLQANLCSILRAILT